MIIKEKILIEVDSPCIFGYTYSYEDCIKMMLKINKEEISGDIYNNELLKEKPFYKIINPKMFVDKNEDGEPLYLIADVDFDDKQYTKEELNKFNTLPWRLAIEGTGDTDKDTKNITNYELKKVNIEFIPEQMYNELNS